MSDINFIGTENIKQHKHQKCGDRCHNAKSHVCRCECGGKNHGKNRIEPVENYFDDLAEEE